MAKLDGVGLAAVGAGGLLVYSGLKGHSLLQTVQGIIQGQPPASQSNVHPIGTPQATPGSSGLTGVANASGISADFMQYVGKVPYVWGEASPKGWDCSGSCNYVICHDMGINIPEFKGGSFDGSQHGPTTFTWLAWAPSHMSKVPKNQVAQNDLVIWQTHMGVCIGDGTYVSAYDTQDGTAVKPISGGGPFGEVATFWRFPSSYTPPGLRVPSIGAL